MATVADSVLDRLTQGLLTLAREHREATEEMQEIFSEKRPFLFMDKESDLRKRKIMREKEYEKSKKGVQAAGELAIALEKLKDDYANHATTIGESEEAVKAALSATTEFADTMTAAQQNMITSTHAILDAGGDIRTSIDPLIATTQEVGGNLVEMNAKQKLAVQQADKFQRSLVDMRNTVYDTIKSMASFKGGIAMAAVGFKKSFDDLEYSLKNQVPIMNTLSGSIKDTAAAYGVSTRALMEVQNENTAALLAASRGVGGLSGSTKFALEEFDKLRTTLHNVTGDYDDSLKLYGQLREQLSFSGAAFSAEEFNKAVDGPNGMIKQMQTLAAITGKSVEQIAAMNTAMMKDRDMRFTMLGLDKKQRQNRLSEIMQYQTLLVSKGMEADQAYEAAMSLEKMNAQIKPKDRYKQAAKMRGIAGALGIAGGEKAMARAMKPPSQWSETEKAENASFATQMETKMGSLAGGGVASQMLGGAFQESMGGELYNTMVKAQSTAGLEQREISKETLENIKTQTNQLQGAQDELLQIKKLFERVVAWGSDAGVFLAGGLTMGLMSLVGQGFLMTKYLAAISAKQGITASPLGGTGKLGGLARGAGALGAAAFVAKDAYDVATAEPGEAKMEDIAAASAGTVGMALGAALGSVVPVLGTALGAAAGGYLGNLAGEVAGKWWDGREKEDMSLKDDLTKQLKEMNKGENPEIKALLQAIESQKTLSKEQAEMYKKNIQALKESTESTKENSDATKAASTAVRVGMSNRRPAQQGASGSW